MPTYHEIYLKKSGTGIPCAKCGKYFEVPKGTIDALQQLCLKCEIGADNPDLEAVNRNWQTEVVYTPKGETVEVTHCNQQHDCLATDPGWHDVTARDKDLYEKYKKLAP